ncbi:hypothetical protein Anas_10136 [Armadillidium nasatum]|uniref:Uncharacterized protein n=1 Tax=Armadillidium nasatum TaxID=96803 RepID=A0A5N5THR9_9CRUS|nr:hypothetical protein Anas_10136 [Armadillidium nasatum]
MDLRHEAEFKIELIEDTEDSVNNVYSEQLSMLEEIQVVVVVLIEIFYQYEKYLVFTKYFEQERNCFEFIDVKSEIEVKKEPFDIEDEVEKEPSDIEDEVKKENSETEEEETTKDELLDKICGSDQNQERNSFEYLNVKSEIEVKEEDPLDIEEEVEKKDRFHIEEEEETPKYEVSHHKISCFDQNEVRINSLK